MKKTLRYLISACSNYNKTKYVLKKAKPRDCVTDYPFISGDVFRDYSDYIVDDARIPFYPKHVKEGEVIFVKTKYLPRFIEHMHMHIRHPYILVTHNGDEEIGKTYLSFLEEKNLFKWFALNATVHHPKLTPLPLGFGNAGSRSCSEELILEELKHPCEKTRLLYLNFSAHTHPDRPAIKDYFSKQNFCIMDVPKEYAAYVRELRMSKFTVSPRGNGIDCNRVWESLLVGTIPIVKTSGLDPLYQNFPVLIVRDWNEVTESFLENKYLEITLKTYSSEKLYADYWLKLIDSYRAGSYSIEKMFQGSRLKQEQFAVRGGRLSDSVTRCANGTSTVSIPS